MGDLNLDEIAEQELLNEAKRGAARASIYGALGWQKCPLKPTNKVFLQNILLSTLSAKRQRDSHPDHESESLKRKLLDEELRAHGFRRDDVSGKKSEHVDGSKSSSFLCEETLCNKKLDNMKSSSCRRNSRCSNLVSLEDLNVQRKDKREHRNCKPSSISKVRKESKQKGTKEGKQ